MTISNEQITFNPNLYIDNMTMAPASNTTLTCVAGACRDSANIMDIVVSSTLTLNMANNGANGLDTGAIAASTWYYVYAIGSSLNNADAAVIASLSAALPLMPLNYDSYRLIDSFYVNSGTHIAAYTTLGNSKVRKKFWTTGLTALSGGTSSTLAAVDLTGAGAVPPLAGLIVNMNCSFTPATAEDSVRVIPSGTAITTSGAVVSSVVAAKAQIVPISVPTAVVSSLAKVDYINSAASGATTLIVTGFDYFL